MFWLLTPIFFFFFKHSSRSINGCWKCLEVGFSLSNQVIRRGLIILTSYSYIGWIISPCLTTYKDLKQGSNMMASMLWTFYESILCFSKQEERFDYLNKLKLQLFKNLEELLIKFIKILDPSFMCFTTRKSSVSHVVSCWCHVRYVRL
jgi:hypothetical protein